MSTHARLVVAIAAGLFALVQAAASVILLSSGLSLIQLALLTVVLIVVVALAFGAHALPQLQRPVAILAVLTVFVAVVLAAAWVFGTRDQAVVTPVGEVWMYSVPPTPRRRSLR